MTNPSTAAASAGSGGLSRLLSMFRRRRHDSTATRRHEHEPHSIFLVAKAERMWRVSQDGAPYGDFETRGDAVRAACFEARASDAAGRPARVLAEPGRRTLPHYEPHFAA